MISLDEFRKVELKVGRVEKVEDIKGSKKLYKLIVDFGEEKRQIISGIKNYYTSKDLQGKQFIFVTNLEYIKIMGEISEGMILAASDGERLCLICPEKEIKNGAKLS